MGYWCMDCYAIKENGNKCHCGSTDLLNTQGGCNLTFSEWEILTKISHDKDFLYAIIDLKKSDPVEFQLKISQFKAQLAQQESSDNKLKCPTCKSTNVRRINGVERGASIAMLGIFSRKINKTFECGSCKFTW